MTELLKALGWNETLQEQFEANNNGLSSPARIITEYKNMYKVNDGNGELLAVSSGKFRREMEQEALHPAAGDWVVVDARHTEGKATIQALLPRKSKFSRNTAGGTTREQIVAANIDIVFLVMALNEDFNVRRMERYLVAAWDSGAMPMMILSKADLCEDITDYVLQMETIAPGVAVHVVSAVTGVGIESVRSVITEGTTAAFIGSSGAGKSTLVNSLYGQEVQLAGSIRADDGKGRHTTTARELIMLPNGGMVMDTPGMRELQLWDQQDSSISAGFQDIEELRHSCRFRDCTHQQEPGCAVRIAVEDGDLELSRLESYFKLERELAYMERKTSQKAQLEQKKYYKQISKQINRKR